MVAVNWRVRPPRTLKSSVASRLEAGVPSLLTSLSVIVDAETAAENSMTTEAVKRASNLGA